MAGAYKSGGVSRIQYSICLARPDLCADQLYCFYSVYDMEFLVHECMCVCVCCEEEGEEQQHSGTKIHDRHFRKFFLKRATRAPRDQTPTTTCCDGRRRSSERSGAWRAAERGRAAASAAERTTRARSASRANERRRSAGGHVLSERVRRRAAASRGVVCWLLVGAPSPAYCSARPRCVLRDC